MRTLGLEGPAPWVVLRSNPAGAGERPVDPRGQSGLALVEVLVAVLLAGVVIAAISVGMFAVLGVTRTTSQTQEMATALMNTTESLRATAYRPCGSTPAPSSARYDQDHRADPGAWAPVADSGITARVTDVEFWSGAAAGGFGDFQATCPSGGDQGRQRLTVTVSMAGRSSVTGTVVVAEPQLETEP